MQPPSLCSPMMRNGTTACLQPNSPLPAGSANSCILLHGSGSTPTLQRAPQSWVKHSALQPVALGCPVADGPLCFHTGLWPLSRPSSPPHRRLASLTLPAQHPLPRAEHPQHLSQDWAQRYLTVAPAPQGTERVPRQCPGAGSRMDPHRALAGGRKGQEGAEGSAAAPPALVLPGDRR